jgi:hypothetical protein
MDPLVPVRMNWKNARGALSNAFMLVFPRTLTGPPGGRFSFPLACLFLLTGCQGPALLHTRLSPPVALVTKDPWQEAAAVAAKVPESSVVIGHGGSMDPLYPEGTVLVLQQMRWENLRPGMTAIYNKDPENPYHMVAHALLKREADEWVAQGLANAQPDRTLVREDNYVGTVVAAFRKETPLDALFIISKLPTYESGTCLMRCHLDAMDKKARTDERRARR